MASRLHFLLFVALLFLGFTASTYLLFDHLQLTYLGSGTPDLCTELFGKGCGAALRSPMSHFLGIPLGGWGMVYYVLLGALLLLGTILEEDLGEVVKAASIAVIGIGIFASSALMLGFLAEPALFCPLCALVHSLNFLLLYPAWKVYRPSFSEIKRSIGKAGRYLFGGKADDVKLARRQVVASMVVVLLGLAFYQWVKLQEASYRGAAADAYDPAALLEEFIGTKEDSLRVDSTRLSAGPLDAPVQIVVFSDFQCPACRHFSEVVRTVFQRNQGQVRLAFKHFPLSSTCNSALKSDAHPQACAAARAAEAAACQGRFWPFHDLLFRTGLENGEQAFDALAQELGLDMEQFRSDYISERVEASIAADIAEGRRLQLDGTPAVFINGRRIRSLDGRTLSLFITFLVGQEVI